MNVESSDIHVRINVLDHENFTRKGDDLKTRTTISLKEALLGFTKNIKHMDGHEVELKRVKPTNPGLKLKVDGEGMPKHIHSYETGKLEVTFDVEFPDSLSSL